MSDDWYTPKYIFDALECRFDLDVAAPEDREYVSTPAKIFLTESALEAEWYGFVWMNPPFGKRGTKRAWLEKFFDHGNGVALTPDRSSTPWWHRSFARADAVLFCRGKPKFIMPTGEVGRSPANGVCLWAAGPRGVSALERAAANGLGALVPGGGRNA